MNPAPPVIRMSRNGVLKSVRNPGQRALDYVGRQALEIVVRRPLRVVRPEDSRVADGPNIVAHLLAFVPEDLVLRAGGEGSLE